MPRLLLVGASGQLGEAMRRRFERDCDVTAPTRQDLDMARTGAIRSAVAALRPDVIINCSAYNKVDAAEDDPISALTVNSWGVRQLARAAGECGATLVHFSTDFVFDGGASEPYAEADPPRPLSTYGVSKLLGEWFASETPRHYVLRVESLFGGPRAKSSVDGLLDAIIHGREAVAFVDRAVSPSYVDDVCEATHAILQARIPSGLYHCVNTGWTTWVEVAREIARLVGRAEAPIRAVAMADVTLRAPRPKFAALSNAKLRAAGVEMYTWQNALARHVARLAGSTPSGA